VLFSRLTTSIKTNDKKLIKQRNPLLFLFLLLTISTSLSPQAKQIDPFENTANLYSIVQDKKDFIWLSGQNGLYRFNGSKVINFSHNNKDWTLPFNWINSSSLKEDELVLTTETKGLWLFNTNTGSTTPIKLKSKTNTFYDAIHHKGKYYAISLHPQSLYRYEIATGESKILKKNIQNNVLVSSEKRVYFNDDTTLYYINSSDIEPKLNIITEINERIISATSNGDTVIIATKSKLYKLSDTGRVTKKTTQSPTSVMTISNDKKSLFTIDLSGTIVKRDLITLKEHNNTFPTVEKLRYEALLHDNSGTLWLVSHRGVQLLTERTVENHHATFDTNYNLLETEVYNNDLYIGSYGKGVKTLSSFNKKVIYNDNRINENLSEKALRITDLLTINNKLYIATFDGLWRYDNKTNSTHKIDLISNGISFNHLILLKLVHVNNLLYIATDEYGLLIYDLNKKEIIKHINRASGLISEEVIDVLPLTNGDIWLATALGIDIINNTTEKIKQIKNQTSAKFQSLVLADDKIFAATKGDGIFVYNQQGQQLSHFAKGINFNYMSLIGNNIYAPATPGLFKITPSNYQISMVTNTEKYSFTDSPLLYKNSVYIANNLGILELPRTTENLFHPKVYISKTTVSGKSYLLNEAISISNSNDVITLELASLDYRPGATKQYRYTLNGNTWQQINSNQLTLTGLAPGSYHIEIMATNSLGQWSNNKAYTEISVVFPWYWTPQIRIVYAVALFCVICFSIWLFYLRNKSIRHIYNILQNDINDYGKTSMQVKRNLTVALTLLSENKMDESKYLLQQCLDNLNEQQKAPEPNDLNGNLLTVAIPFLAKYLHRKYQTKLTFQFDLNESELQYELRADLYKVIFEAITSAILIGSGRSFKVVIQKFKTKIWLNISDDNQSFINFNRKINIDISMYCISQIANKYNGSINTFNEQGNGSQLILSIPSINNYLTPRNPD